MLTRLRNGPSNKSLLECAVDNSICSCCIKTTLNSFSFCALQVFAVRGRGMMCPSGNCSPTSTRNHFWPLEPQCPAVLNAKNPRLLHLLQQEGHWICTSNSQSFLCFSVFPRLSCKAILPGTKRSILDEPSMTVAVVRSSASLTLTWGQHVSTLDSSHCITWTTYTAAENPCLHLRVRPAHLAFWQVGLWPPSYQLSISFTSALLVRAPRKS